jgi:hypothetical protein
MHFAVFYSQSRPLRPMSSLVLSFIPTAPSLVVKLGRFPIFHLLSPLRGRLNIIQVVPNSSACVVQLNKHISTLMGPQPFNPMGPPSKCTRCTENITKH